MDIQSFIVKFSECVMMFCLNTSVICSWRQICICEGFVLFVCFSVKNGELIARHRRPPNSEKMNVGMLLTEEKVKICFFAVWVVAYFWFIFKIKILF